MIGVFQSHRFRTFAVLAACTAAIAACGEESGEQTAGAASAGAEVTKAAKAVAAAREPIEFAAAAEPIEVSDVRGRQVWFINANEQAPILVQWRTTVQRELERLGVEVTLFDGKEDPSSWVRGIQQAIAARADAIVVQAIPSDLIANQLEQAEKAGIPVVTSIGGKPSIPGASKVPGVTTDVTFDYRVPGRLLAEWFVADSKGKGEAIVFSFKGQPSSDTEVQALVQEVDRLCADCKTTVKDAPVTTWGDGTLQTQTKTLLQANPNVTHLLPAFDGMVLGIAPAIMEAGLQERVRVGSFNAEVPLMEAMKAGSPLKMNIGGPNDWFAASLADATLRTLVGAAPVSDYGIDFRVFDEDNIQSLDVSRERSLEWYGVDFIEEYRQLWKR